MIKVAIDTNVLIYLHDTELSYKREKANELISINPVICAQVISEYLNVCHKRLKITKQDSLNSLMAWLPYCELSVFGSVIYTKSMGLIQKYQFQMFDAIIVSSALLSDCEILYSEDMQHNLIVEKQLKIVNPFI
jgi:predicted nucleic acid-binding protein